MTNVTVQEALNNTLVMLDALTVEFGITGLEPLIAEVKAALANIEKCEPVGYVANTLKFPIKPNGSYWIETEKKEPLFTIPIFTSPISKEFVGLTYKDKVDLRENTDWYNFPNDLIEATEAKLKQLNTEKG